MHTSTHSHTNMYTHTLQKVISVVTQIVKPWDRERDDLNVGGYIDKHTHTRTTHVSPVLA